MPYHQHSAATLSRNTAQLHNIDSDDKDKDEDNENDEDEDEGGKASELGLGEE